MRTLLMVCGLGTLLSAMALAEEFKGSLIDASCFEAKKDASTCTAISSTTEFALFAAGKVYKLDPAGNSKAAEAMKTRADRPSNPAKTASATVMAKVTGSKGSNDVLNVEAIEVE